MHHELKTWPMYYEAIRTGAKAFELRSEADRTFEKGDVLRLREWQPDDRGGHYTGRELWADVTYVLRDAAHFGLVAGFACLSLGEVRATDKSAHGGSSLCPARRRIPRDLAALRPIAQRPLAR